MSCLTSSKFSCVYCGVDKENANWKSEDDCLFSWKIYGGKNISMVLCETLEIFQNAKVDFDNNAWESEIQLIESF